MPGNVLTDAPTFAECLEWRDLLHGEWMGSKGTDETLDRSLDAEQEAEEALYFQRFEVSSPQGKMAVRTGSAPSDADAAIDSLVPPDIQIKVRPVRDRQKYREQADKLVRYGTAQLHAWRQRKDILRLIAADQVIRRVGIARVTVDDRLWPMLPEDLTGEALDDWEAKNRRRNPILLERRNPRHVRWRQTDEGEFLVVVEHYRTTVLEAMAAFGHLPLAKKLLAGRRGNDQVDVSDVWRGLYRCQMIENQPIYPGKEGVHKHGYVEIPYCIAPFRELGFEEPSLRYRGMLTNAAGLYPIESQVLTMQVWMLAWNAWRTWTAWTKDNRDIPIIPGQVIPLDHRIGEYIEMLKGEPVPPELLQMASIVDSYIQRNGVAQGPRTQEGTRSAQQVWAIQSIRQMKIDPAKQSLQGLVERALSLAAMEVETQLKGRLTLPVPGRDREGRFLGEISIGKEDISGYWEGFTANFGRRLDPALLEQAKALMTLSTNNWMPMRTSWELSGLTDVPQEWEDELLRQSINRLDFMIEMAGLEEIKEFFGPESPEYQLIYSRMQAQRRGGGAPNQIMGGGQMQPNAMRGPTAAPSPNGGALPPASRAEGRTAQAAQAPPGAGQPPAPGGGGF